LRKVAINLMRRQRPGLCLGDVWSELTADLPIALGWMLAALENFEIVLANLKQEPGCMFRVVWCLELVVQAS